MDSLIATTENCRYCLMCRHAAPVGHVTHNETLTPHGIALVVAMQRRGLLQWNESTLRVLYAEPDSGNCRAHCVTDQPLPAAIAAVRAQVAADGLAPPAAYEIRNRMRSTHSAFGEHLPSSGSGETALFVGDEAHNLWLQAENAALRLVTATGEAAVPVGIGLSSGYLACSLGFPELAREQAEKCIAEIRATGAHKVLVLSPQELFAFTTMYRERLGITWPKDIEVVDLACFLADACEAGKLTVQQSSADAPAAGTYVDPTHAVRAPGRFDAVRTLCSLALGCPPSELFWRRKRAHPVGSTALQFTRPDIAARLTRARLEDARKQGTKTLICEDPATLHALRQHAEGIRVIGLYETLADHLE